MSGEWPCGASHSGGATALLRPQKAQRSTCCRPDSYIRQSGRFLIFTVRTSPHVIYRAQERLFSTARSALSILLTLFVSLLIMDRSPPHFCGLCALQDPSPDMSSFGGTWTIKTKWTKEKVTDPDSLSVEPPAVSAGISIRIASSKATYQFPHDLRILSLSFSSSS